MHWMMVINMDHNDIWKEKSRLERERGVKLREFLADYDSKVYNPNIKQLQENCEKLGHEYSFHGYNFIKSYTIIDVSCAIYKCNYCGASKQEEINE